MKMNKNTRDLKCELIMASNTCIDCLEKIILHMLICFAIFKSNHVLCYKNFGSYVAHLCINN